MSAALERQIRPIYDALDTGSNKSAIVACNKLLKKHPRNELVKALKALALVRSQKVEESLILCDEILACKPTDDATLSAMMHVLRGLGRHYDMVTMFEDAYKQQPTNEELGAQTFFANVRTGSWKAAQQIATKMYKQFQEDRYLYWSVMSAILQANDPITAPTMRTLLYKLAHRLVTSSPTPSYVSADRFHLHLTILRELCLFDEAEKLLQSDIGKTICANSLVCDEIRRQIWQIRGLWKEEGQRAEQRIVENKDRNWLEFLSVLDATFSCVVPLGGNAPSQPSESQKSECSDRILKTRELFTRVVEEDGTQDRSAALALLELEKRARDHGLSTDAPRLIDLMIQYFQKIGDKACCFEDLKPYLHLGGNDLSQWTSFLESLSPSTTSITDLRRFINIHKLLRFNLRETQLTVELESARAALYIAQYIEGLKLGAGLPSTELQPADDLIILTGHVLVHLWHLTQEEAHLYNAAAVLEFASANSNHSFQIRLLLIQIYRLLGAPSLALEHYRQMNVKQVQNDTLSHFVLTRASTFSLAAVGDLTWPTECLESSQIYSSNSSETADFVVRAFTSEKYSQIPEFIAFEDRLDNSLQRDVVKVEHTRMRLAHEPATSEIIDMELIELKFIFDRVHHDNRDFGILPNYQPRALPSFNQHTLLFKKSSGLGWLWTFLKVYIRAFQQASDLDDAVEEKLLIGDRPKPSHDPEFRIHWKERLIRRNPGDLDDLTPDELSFLDFTTALAVWLEPYHDYIRPSPATVLAEAAKQTELKTGHSIKGIDIPPQNGTSTNGHTKKEDEVPPVKEAPEAVSSFFENMQNRFREVQGQPSPSEALHVATLTQEALIIFGIETLRFKPQSIVKTHKLGALVQIFRRIRTHAIEVLQRMSLELVQKSELDGTPERRKAFVDACQPMAISSGVDHDFVLGVAKRVTDARKKVTEGVGKGLGRVCSEKGNAAK